MQEAIPPLVISPAELELDRGRLINAGAAEIIQLINRALSNNWTNELRMPIVVAIPNAPPDVIEQVITLCNHTWEVTVANNGAVLVLTEKETKPKLEVVGKCT